MTTSLLKEIRKSPRPAKVAKKFHKENEPVDEGSYRFVHFIDERHVLKIPNREYDGQNCNKAERKIWKKALGTKLAPMLAPVIDSCPRGSWLIMERMKPHNMDYGMVEAYRFLEKFEEVCEKVLGFLIDDVEISTNVMLNKRNKLVVVDYGGLT